MLVSATLRLETGQYRSAAELLDSVDLDAAASSEPPPGRRGRAERELAVLLHQLRAVAAWRTGHRDRGVAQMRGAMRRARSPELGSEVWW